MLHRSKDINCIAMLQSQNIKGDIYIKDSHEWKSKNKYVIEHDKKGKDGNCDIFSLHANHLCVKFYTYNIQHSIKSILPLLFINVLLPLKCTEEGRRGKQVTWNDCSSNHQGFFHLSAQKILPSFHNS